MTLNVACFLTQHDRQLVKTVEMLFELHMVSGFHLSKTLRISHRERIDHFKRATLKNYFPVPNCRGVKFHYFRQISPPISLY